MLLFHRIDDAEAVVRIKGGVYKQTEVYRRGDKVYVRHGAGYVRVTDGFGESWGTSAPGVNVLDMSDTVDGLTVDVTHRRAPRWTGVHT